ncbi:hypothetical protein D046_4478A, partial [Vibrio parahaemolyticus V-223/04]
MYGQENWHGIWH